MSGERHVIVTSSMKIQARPVGCMQQLLAECWVNIIPNLWPLHWIYYDMGKRESYRTAPFSLREQRIVMDLQN